jgi:UDPglucose 6-dehydrogenase
VVQRLFGTLTGKRIAVLGFAFKADTNDTREAPAIRICHDLLEEGAQLAIYDPKVSEAQIQADLGEATWQRSGSVLEAARGADALLVLTEWAEFRQLPWAALAAAMRKPAWLFDARAITDAPAARTAGLNVWTVGQG